MFIAQYVAEAVLGITNNNVNGTVDQIHASVQIQGSQVQGYSDAFYGNGVINGGSHYPRGITTSLWWLNATNNPAYPVAISPPLAPTISRALAGDRQVSILWQGVAFAKSYNVKRSVQSGGPYTTATNALIGASFLDAGLNNGTTYYYILTATNQIGESAPSPEVSATPVPSISTNIFAVLAGSTITISWPASHMGWILQTNAMGLANPAAWSDIPDSVTHSQMSFPILPNQRAKFFRLRSP
jgi:hypothetical protein